jgi:ABC-type Zn uptake system ZnuABC Zn-binding protein ZnuA
MIELNHVRLRRRTLLLGTTAFALGSTRFSSFAQTPAAGFPEFPELQPLPEISEREGGPLNVVASTGIIGDLVSQIGGARVSVATILPANADPHSYEPAPQDIAKVDDAEVVFVHGLDLDPWVETIVENAGGDFALITVTDGIATTSFGEGHDDHEDEGDEHEDDDDHDHDVDPHVWFDPTRTSQMVANIAAALTDADPDGADGYAARLAAYQIELNDLDAQIAERIALVPENRRTIVTNHDALGYFADRYGLAIVGTVIPGMSAQAEPSAQEIAALLEVIAAEQVTAIFAENTINPTLAEELAAQAGIQVVASLFTDTLGEPGSGADTYINLMRYDTRVIVEALIGS